MKRERSKRKEKTGKFSVWGIKNHRSVAVRALGGAPGAPPGAASVTYMNMYTLTYVDVIRYSVTAVLTKACQSRVREIDSDRSDIVRRRCGHLMTSLQIFARVTDKSIIKMCTLYWFVKFSREKGVLVNWP